MFPLIVAAVLGLGVAATVAMTTRTARPARTDRQRRERRAKRRKKREAKREATPEPDVPPQERGELPPDMGDLPPEPPKPRAPAKKKVSPPATKKDAAKIAKHKVKLEPTPDVGPKEAAASLFKFASQKIRDEEFEALGTKDRPSKKLKGYQRAMRNLKADGQYGPKTRARGTELLGKPFPIRRKAAPPAPEPEPEVEPPAPEPRRPPPEPPAPPEPEPESKPEPESEPEPEPEGRTPTEAARDLLGYVQGLGKKGRSKALGYKGRPNATIEAAQVDMGRIKVDGIYANETRGRGRELINKSFPAR